MAKGDNRGGGIGTPPPVPVGVGTGVSGSQGFGQPPPTPIGGGGPGGMPQQQNPAGMPPPDFFNQLIQQFAGNQMRPGAAPPNAPFGGGGMGAPSPYGAGAQMGMRKPPVMGAY